jgi:hypothetical protein
MDLDRRNPGIMSRRSFHAIRTRAHPRVISIATFDWCKRGSISIGRDSLLLGNFEYFAWMVNLEYTGVLHKRLSIPIQSHGSSFVKRCPTHQSDKQRSPGSAHKQWLSSPFRNRGRSVATGAERCRQDWTQIRNRGGISVPYHSSASSAPFAVSHSTLSRSG